MDRVVPCGCGLGIGAHRHRYLGQRGGRCRRRQVSLDLVFEQAALLGVEALGLGGELHALEQRVLVGEFGVQGLTVAQFGEQPHGHLALGYFFTLPFFQGRRDQVAAPSLNDVPRHLGQLGF